MKVPVKADQQLEAGDEFYDDDRRAWYLIADHLFEFVDWLGEIVGSYPGYGRFRRERGQGHIDRYRAKQAGKATEINRKDSEHPSDNDLPVGTLREDKMWTLAGWIGVPEGQLDLVTQVAKTHEQTQRYLEALI